MASLKEPHIVIINLNQKLKNELEVKKREILLRTL
jgi:hypothetical protein